MVEAKGTKRKHAHSSINSDVEWRQRWPLFDPLGSQQAGNPISQCPNRVRSYPLTDALTSNSKIAKTYNAFNRFHCAHMEACKQPDRSVQQLKSKTFKNLMANEFTCKLIDLFSV